MTTQQLRFIDEYFADLDARKAALRAGYSDSNPAVTASKLMAKPHIRAEIDRRKDTEHRSQIMTANETLARLSKIARSTEATNSDRIQALKLLGTYNHLFVKRIETAGPGEFAHLTDDEVESELRKLAAERMGCNVNGGSHARANQAVLQPA